MTTVVVVDDNDTTRAMLRGILRQDGLDVVGEARNGVSALDMVKRLKPALVCLDVQMPGDNGLDVLRKIKTTHPATKVLTVTGSAERETVEAAIAGGASAYVVKPFNAGSVTAAARRALAGT